MIIKHSDAERFFEIYSVFFSLLITNENTIFFLNISVDVGILSNTVKPSKKKSPSLRKMRYSIKTI